MTIKFTVSAPGKIILNGEHSVVYDKPALAGVVGLRTHVTLKVSAMDTKRFFFLKKPNPLTAQSIRVSSVIFLGD